jgi:hypothetical protein
MTLDLPYDIYGVDNPINFTDLNNKLFCTFTTLDGVGELSTLATKKVHYHVQQDICTRG